MNARRTWMAAGVAVLIAGGALSAITWPAPVAVGEPRPAATARATPVPPGRDAVWTRANAALAANDRDGFLDIAVGDARDALARWWDATAVLGRDVAVITPWNDAYVYLGAALDHAPRVARGIGDDDGGLVQLQGGYYDTTWEGDRLATLSPTAEPAPWDDTALTARRADRVTLYGAADEAGLLDDNITVATDAAERARQIVTDLGGTPLVDGFLVALTDDDDRMRRWQFGQRAGWAMDIAGFAVTRARPADGEPWIPAEVATGPGSSGAVLVLGPRSADQRLDTFTHEFVHALHYAAAPRSEGEVEDATAEGIAEWATARSGASADRFDEPDVRRVIAEHGVEAFSNTAIRSADAWTAYAAAASFYAFVDAAGGDAWRLAVDAQRSGGPLAAAAARQDPAFTVEAWQAWIAAR